MGGGGSLESLCFTRGVQETFRLMVRDPPLKRKGDEGQRTTHAEPCSVTEWGVCWKQKASQDHSRVNEGRMEERLARWSRLIPRGAGGEEARREGAGEASQGADTWPGQGRGVCISAMGLESWGQV